MLESNFEAINNDLGTLVKDAQALFQAATALTGEKADEVRNRGMRLLDAALVHVQDTKQDALVTGKKMAVSANGYLKENPWSAIGVAASVGILAGLIMGRQKSGFPVPGSVDSV